MLLPISARLASSCSRNGISAADTPTSCMGLMSMYCTSLVATWLNSPFTRLSTVSPTILPFSSTSVSAGASTPSNSSSARRLTTSSVTLPLVTLR